MANAAGKDQVEYVLALLGPGGILPKDQLAKDYTNYDGDYAQYPIDIARFRRVVQLAAERSGWGKQKLGNGFGMGIAVHRSFLTYVATVVQAEVKDNKVVIRQVDTALDAGTIVNPTTVRQQFEGAAVMGTSIAFFGEITATNGVINQSNFDSFQVARMKEDTARDQYPHCGERRATCRHWRARVAPVRAGSVQRDFHRHRQAHPRNAPDESGAGVTPADVVPEALSLLKTDN